LTPARIGCAVVAGLAIAVSAAAQQTPDSVELARMRRATASDIEASAAPRPSVAQDIEYIALVARPTGLLLRTLQLYTEERSDKQVGATSSASGTTTLVSKGTVPKVLGLAVENGAVTQTQSGTTVTFRTNVGGALNALSGKGFFQLSPGDDDPSLWLLSRLSASASFDTTRGGGNGTLTADQQQLSQWTARLQVINRRDPTGPAALAKWRGKLLPLQTGIAQSAVVLSQAIEHDPAVQAWIAATADAIRTVGAAAARGTSAEQAAAIEAALESAEARFPASLQPQTVDALSAFERLSSAFVIERDTLLRGLASGALVSAEYTSDHPARGPRTSNLRLVGEVGGAVDLTGNASLTFFHQNPVGVTSSVRDVQFSGEMDIKLGSADTVGAFVFSAAGKFVRQFENGFSDDGIMIPDSKGTIAAGQLKLTVPVKGSGVKIPLSVTFANRTELIKEKVVRANVGITYDLDTIFARFRP
jgi:hypothetical protein